jgi:N-methylhydantoinase A
VLGFIDAGDRFGDEIELVEGPARAALESVISGAPEQAAARVRAAADRKGAAAVSALLADAGVAAADVVLYAFGGAGALHACGVAEAAGITRVRSFLFGSIFSACGVASGDVRQTADTVLTDGGDAVEAVARLVRRAHLDLEAELLDPMAAALSLLVTTTGDERVFTGSGEEIVDAVAATPGAERHAWRRLALTSTLTVPAAPPIDVEPFNGVATRTVRWRDEPIETPLLGIDALRGEATVAGPALLHLAGVVNAVAPGWTVRLDGHANIEWSAT